MVIHKMENLLDFADIVWAYNNNRIPNKLNVIAWISGSDVYAFIQELPMVIWKNKSGSTLITARIIVDDICQIIGDAFAINDDIELIIINSKALFERRIGECILNFKN